MTIVRVTKFFDLKGIWAIKVHHLHLKDKEYAAKSSSAFKITALFGGKVRAELKALGSRPRAFSPPLL